MGIENNEAILATTWSDEVVNSIRAWVKDLDPSQQGLFCFVPSLINRKTTILLAPSGSKRGWSTDYEISQLREVFIVYLKTFDYEDGSSPIEWIEVGYGEFGQTVLRGNCENCYSDEKYYHADFYTASPNDKRGE